MRPAAPAVSTGSAGSAGSAGPASAVLFSAVDSESQVVIQVQSRYKTSSA